MFCRVVSSMLCVPSSHRVRFLCLVASLPIFSCPVFVLRNACLALTGCLSIRAPFGHSSKPVTSMMSKADLLCRQATGDALLLPLTDFGSKASKSFKSDDWRVNGGLTDRAALWKKTSTDFLVVARWWDDMWRLAADAGVCCNVTRVRKGDRVPFGYKWVKRELFGSTKARAA